MGREINNFRGSFILSVLHPTSRVALNWHATEKDSDDLFLLAVSSWAVHIWHKCLCAHRVNWRKELFKVKTSFFPHPPWFNFNSNQFLYLVHLMATQILLLIQQGMQCDYKSKQKGRAASFGNAAC